MSMLRLSTIPVMQPLSVNIQACFHKTHHIHINYQISKSKSKQYKKVCTVSELFQESGENKANQETAVEHLLFTV